MNECSQPAPRAHRPVELRRAGPADRPALLALLREWIHYAPAEAHYHWMYEACPHGPALTWLAADRASGDVVACTSCFPRRFVVEGRRTVGSIGGDTFVLPAWRGQRLAASLHQACNADLWNVGLEFHCGFPNPKNQRAFDSAGGGHRWLRMFRSLTAPLSAAGLRVLPATLATPLLHWRDAWNTRSAPRVEVEEFLPQGDGLWQKLAALWEDSQHAFPISLNRDPAFFRWRYGEAVPAAPVLICGRSTASAGRASGTTSRLESFAALSREGPRHTLHDFFACSERAATGLLVQLMARLRREGADTVSVTLNRFEPYYWYFRRLGFFPSLRHSLYLMVDRRCEAAGELANPRGWHLTHADLDYSFDSIG